jgi:hypothetical protein
MKTPNPVRSRRKIVTLADLAPRQDIRGGAGRRVFGAEPIHGATSSRPRAADGQGKPAKHGKEGGSRR